LDDYPAKLKRRKALRTICDVCVFVFVILGIPVLIFLGGDSNAPPLLDTISFGIVYGLLFLGGTIFGALIIYAIITSIWRRIHGVTTDAEAKPPSILALVFWSWGATLCIIACVCAANELLNRFVR
jgi:TRAP-type C4-dicarboxylate transport system permease small subunit